MARLPRESAAGGSGKRGIGKKSGMRSTEHGSACSRKFRRGGSKAGLNLGPSLREMSEALKLELKIEQLVAGQK